jgi:hypothetical protein
MHDSIASMSLVGIIEIVGPIVLACALTYGAMQWWKQRASTARLSEAAARGRYREAADHERRHESPGSDFTSSDLAHPEHQRTTRLESQARPAQPAPASMDLPPSVGGKLRSGREGDRPSEDDIVRAHFGPRGVPGEPERATDLSESETQIPKGLDPGHTA